MSLWQHPRMTAGLCAVAVLVCAAAPAVFLTAVDAAVLGRSAPVEDAYTAPTPKGEDYYILRQLQERRRQQSNTYALDRPEEERQSPLKMYIGAQNSLETMQPGYDYQQMADDALQALADSGTIAQEWADWATDWGEDTEYYTYNGNGHSLSMPYYATDSLGFVTLKRFALEQGALYTAFSLTMDSRTGIITQVWISAPRQDDNPPPAPDEAGLRAFAAQAGLDTLEDWAVPDNTPYGHALYSANGEALITAAVSPYEYTGWVSNATITSDRWFLSLGLQPCTAEELPTQVS